MSARYDFAKLHANTSGPHHQGQTSTEAQSALDEIDRLRGRESQLEAQVETLEIVISRLREVCDAAYTLVREDDDELADQQWCVLLCALDDARYEPRP